MVTALSSTDAASLRRSSLTYSAVGTTPVPQPGYLNRTRARTLGSSDFDASTERLFSWRMHELAGLKVLASSPRAAEDVVAVMRLGVGRLSLRIPCRVIYVIEEPDRAGFAYGTLPGHPVSGEELFLLERRGEGRITFTITSFSAPATALARLAAPVTRAAQLLMTRRYLVVLDVH